MVLHVESTQALPVNPYIKLPNITNCRIWDSSTPDLMQVNQVFTLNNEVLKNVNEKIALTRPD